MPARCRCWSIAGNCGARLSPARSARRSSGTISLSTARYRAGLCQSVLPASDPLTGILEAFAIYAVGFVARPVGAAIFGHYGDRIGRKAALIATLLLMGLATFRWLLFPVIEDRNLGRHDSDGSAHHARDRCRRRMGRLGAARRWSGHVTNGSIADSLLPGRSSACRRGCFWRISRCWLQRDLPAPQFVTWGWRIPFLLSIVLVGIGLYIRLGIQETPVFTRLVAEDRSNARRLWK